MEKMDIYEAGRAVPTEAKKPFNNGSFSGTDINPMWRIKKLTELFGPAGIGWYYEVLSERCEAHGDTVMAIVDLNLYIKVDGEWSKPIYGTGGNKLLSTGKSGVRTSDEGYKMALTDALSVACKALGIGADVYFERDTTKYSAYQTPQVPAAPAAPIPTTIDQRPVCEDCGNYVEGVSAGGKRFAPADIARMAQSKYGRTLCYPCAQKAKAAG